MRTIDPEELCHLLVRRRKIERGDEVAQLLYDSFLAYDAGQRDRVLAWFEEKAKKSPRSPAVLRGAVRLLRQIDPVSAVELSRIRVAAWPLEHEAHYGLVTSLEVVGTKEAMLEAARERLVGAMLEVKVEKKDPQFVIINSLKRWNKLLRHIKAGAMSDRPKSMAARDFQLPAFCVPVNASKRIFSLGSSGVEPVPARPAAGLTVVVDGDVITQPEAPRILSEPRFRFITPLQVLDEIGDIFGKALRRKQVQLTGRIPPALSQVLIVRCERPDPVFERLVTPKDGSPSETDRVILTVAGRFRVSAVLSNDQDIWAGNGPHLIAERYGHQPRFLQSWNFLNSFMTAASTRGAPTPRP